MYDFFIIGDIMIDSVVVVSDPQVVRSVDESTHTVTFPFPSKLNLHQAPQIFTGGNAFNAAYALRKLGFGVAIYSILGNDQEGKEIQQQLNSQGIDTAQLEIDPNQPTNKSIILNIVKDRLVLAHHYKRNYNLPQIPDSAYIYLTSLGEDDSQILRQIVQQKVHKNFQLVFSPGTRQLQEPFAQIKEVLQVTDVLILNKREAKVLSRLNSDSDENLLRGLQRFGPKTVVITRASRGSVAIHGDQIIKVGALQSDGVDSTGAGDTYGATLAGALRWGKSLQQAMEMGSIHAASVVSAMGSTNGILNKEELEQMHTQKVSELKYIEPPALILTNS